MPGRSPDTSIDYTQVLDDYQVLASIGTVGDAYDNALAESFVDSYKTELISDRVWRSRAEVELASVKWVVWFNHDRLHSSIGDIPPIEFEALHAPNPVDLSVAAIASGPQTGLQPVASRPSASISLPTSRSPPRTLSLLKTGPLRPRQQRSRDERPLLGLSDR
jgi:hypothetical protein